MKGHDERKYFWWTFFVPLLGALMVIALPDRKEMERGESKVMSLWKSEEPNSVRCEKKFVAVNADGTISASDSIQTSAHSWRCSGCGQTISESPCPFCGQK